jgi:hypothetical protein
MLMNIFIFILILIGLSCVFVPFFMDENQRINDESYYNKKNKET